VGFLLHHDQKEHPPCLCRFGNDIYRLQTEAGIYILDKNLLKAYLEGLGLYFWPFQRPFKAIFRHSGFLGWEPEFLCAFSVARLNVKKRGNFERIIYLKGSF
jgi:hypothetical protein